jgi:hypothetical protein
MFIFFSVTISRETPSDISRLRYPGLLEKTCFQGLKSRSRHHKYLDFFWFHFKITALITLSFTKRTMVAKDVLFYAFIKSNGSINQVQVQECKSISSSSWAYSYILITCPSVCFCCWADFNTLQNILEILKNCRCTCQPRLLQNSSLIVLSCLAVLLNDTETCSRLTTPQEYANNFLWKFAVLSIHSPHFSRKYFCLVSVSKSKAVPLPLCRCQVGNE